MVAAGQAATTRREALLHRVGAAFTRREPRLQARRYVAALSADIARKNGWQIAEWIGDTSPNKTQRLLNHAKWDEHAALGIVAAEVSAGLDAAADPLAVLVLDESGQEKKGNRTCGVKRQYVGCAGRVSNAINVVYATLATHRGHALLAARPYLPREWAEDPALRARAKVPDPVVFATKPALAVAILTDLHTAGLLPGWATGDEVYGRDGALRRWCEQHDIGYVLGVPCSFTLTLTSGRRVRADQAVKLTTTAKAWNRASAGAGSKGARLYAWAWVATISPQHSLLVRRNLADPTDLAYFICYVPGGRPATLRTLVQVAGRRWPVEEDFQVGKDQFGLDHSQVRHYTALLRHLVLTIVALAACALTAADHRGTSSTLAPPPTSPDDPPPADPGLIPLTVAEVRRLANHVAHTGERLAHHLRWSWWRRRHQARARWFHHRTRLRRELKR